MIVRCCALALAVFVGCGGDELPPPSGEGAESPSESAGSQDASTTTSGGTDESESESESDSTDETGEDPDGIQVLFVGNSYTFYNELPTLVAGVADGVGETTLITDSRTKPGAFFAEHLNDPTVTDAIASGEYDFVVLQGQSIEPVHPTYEADAELNALSLAELVTDISAEPVFFETWARGPGHADYDEGWTGGTPSAMQVLMHDAYAGYALDSEGTLGPVGQAWIDLLIDDVDVNLYDLDLEHPSIEGSYLAACVFYATISGLSPVGATGWPDAISGENALVIQNAAAAAVFD